jgi:hypothetical protein
MWCGDMVNVLMMFLTKANGFTMGVEEKIEKQYYQFYKQTIAIQLQWKPLVLSRGWVAVNKK